MKFSLRTSLCNDKLNRVNLFICFLELNSHFGHASEVFKNIMLQHENHELNQALNETRAFLVVLPTNYLSELPVLMKNCVITCTLTF